MFPILFGAPGFGNEERDQWIRVLQLFLQDPFAPHAVNVGGTTQIQYGWTVPAGAINGSSGGIIDINTGTSGLLPWSRLTGIPSFWQNNAFGIRELNEFSANTHIGYGDTRDVSDRPGLLFVFGFPDNNFALFMCGFSPLDFSGNVQILSSGDGTDFETYSGSSGTLNVFFDGSVWKVENNFEYCSYFYMVFMSMGEQVGNHYNDLFVGDGVTDRFTLSASPAKTIVYASNGGSTVRVGSSADAYLDGNDFVFNTPPPLAAGIGVFYTAG